MERSKAEDAIRHGSNAGFISAALTFAFAIAATVGSSEAFDTLGVDAWWTVDAIVMAALAWGVRRGSPAASVLITLYFIAGKVAVAASTGQLSGVGVSLIFLYFFARAAQGAFTLRKLDKEEEDNPVDEPDREWMKVVGAGVGVIVVSLVGLGLMLELGMIPDTAVVHGDALPDHVPEFLRAQGMIEEDEEVLLYYSTALFSFENEGNLLTTRGVVSYEDIDGEMWQASLPYEEIAQVTVEEKGSAMQDALIAVYPEEGEGFYLNISVEGGGLQTFLDTLAVRRGYEPGPEKAEKAAKISGGS